MLAQPSYLFGLGIGSIAIGSILVVKLASHPSSPACAMDHVNNLPISNYIFYFIFHLKHLKSYTSVHFVLVVLDGSVPKACVYGDTG